ncbi:reverse transcriptase domain-containing protein [Tanacetum coccineum]
MSRPEVAGRLQKWIIELREYDIQYRPRISVKGQILADFIVERLEYNPQGAEFSYALRFRFDVTNNEAEYEALIAGLRIAKQMGVKILETNVDSRLVAIQVLVEELNEKSIIEAEVLAVMEDEGDTMHAGTRSVVAKAIRRGYYRPTMHADITGQQHKKDDSGMSRLPDSPPRTTHSKIGLKSYAFANALPPSSTHKPMAHRTIIKSSNGDTLFSLTYRTKAVILAEIDMPTLRTAEIDMVQNDEALEINLDLLEERREQAAIRDLMYWNNDANHAEDGRKLGPKWEGPYHVTEALRRGAYKLRDHNGKLLSQTWNVHNLKKCYVYEV